MSIDEAIKIIKESRGEICDQAKEVVITSLEKLRKLSKIMDIDDMLKEVEDD